MSDIQKHKKVAVKRCNEEVIQNKLIPMDYNLTIELIQSEKQIRSKLGIKKSSFNLLFLLVSSGELINISMFKRVIAVGFNQFYTDVNSLENKGLIGILKQGRIIYYYATIKAWSEFSQFYPSFKFKQPKIDRSGE